MKKPAKKRKPLVVWGIVSRDGYLMPDTTDSREAAGWRAKYYGSSYPHAAPFRVAKFVEVVR